MKSNLDVAKEILAGKWGNGAERRKRLAEAGYNYDDVQGIVNALLSDNSGTETETNDSDNIQSEPVIQIIGKEVMEVEINLNEYRGIKIIFTSE